MSNFDCSPTLTDSQVLEFCQTGHIMLEGVVPDEINRRTVAWLDDHRRQAVSSGGRKYGSGQVQRLLAEDWFVENVLRNPVATGVMRSLLGADYAEPSWLSWFQGSPPGSAGQWHVDAGSVFSHESNVLKWFYYATDTLEQLGPTEFVIGSHHVYNQVRFMAHYDSVRGIWKSSAPAGSIFVTAYAMWHRRARSTVGGERYMLTSSVHRTTPPQRDWIVEPDFDFGDVDYMLDEPRFGEQYLASIDTARMFFWLCGRLDEFKKLDGPAWPMPVESLGRRHGAPPPQ